MTEDIEEISLIDELSQLTKERVPASTPPTEQSETTVNTTDFTPVAPTPEIAKSELGVSAPEAQEPENTTTPEESADSIIDMIDLSITSIALPVMAKKLKKKFGEELFEKAQLARVQEAVDPEKLTDVERELILKYKKFEAVMKQIRSDVPFSEEEIRKLTPSTIRLCEKHGIQVNENVAFGANVLKVLSTRIIDIVML